MSGIITRSVSFLRIDHDAMDLPLAGTGPRSTSAPGMAEPCRGTSSSLPPPRRRPVRCCAPARPLPASGPATSSSRPAGVGRPMVADGMGRRLRLLESRWELSVTDGGATSSLQGIFRVGQTALQGSIDHRAYSRLDQKGHFDDGMTRGDRGHSGRFVLPERPPACHRESKERYRSAPGSDRFRVPVPHGAPVTPLAKVR
jgi:hypothetical protein